ncbi:MAG TPA: hypothetical protein VKU02_05180 [Gemmataceae bacterium]|nr:hypothetical protein [Gemmataceae bacterium]
MQKRTWYGASILALTLAWSAGAQPPDGPGRRPGPGRGFPPSGGIERILDDLKLADKKLEQARAAVRVYQDNVRKLVGLARSELLLKLKETLSEDEFKRFQDGLNRPAVLADGRGRRAGGNRGVSVNQIVERILSFDKNKDGKVAKDELPERMQNLIERGDTNKDGVLDSAEINKLATELARDRDTRLFDGRGGPGGGFRGGPGRGPAPGNGFDRVLADLSLSEQKRATAQAAIKAHLDNVRKLTELARADLLLQMSDVLSAEESKIFKAALERQPDFGPPFAGRGGRFARLEPPAANPRSQELEKRLDQLQQDLENLRREIRR